MTCCANRCECGTQAELKALRGFAQEMMEHWPQGDVEGGDLHQAAVKHGLLKVVTRTQPCGEGCNCADWYEADDWERGVECYQPAFLLKGADQ